MKKYLLNLLFLFSTLSLCSFSHAIEKVVEGTLNDPDAVEHFYHGQKYVDDFGWIRDKNYPVVNDPKVLKFVAEENTNSDNFFKDNETLLNTVYEEIKSRRPKSKKYVSEDENYIYHAELIGDAKYSTISYIDKRTREKKYS